MDWLGEINDFPSFEMKESGLDVAAKEANMAVSKYEKALKNAQNDSLDIAIIELRKLVVLYPEMGQAAILLGCCQMQENQFQNGLRNFNKASLANLPMKFATRLDSYIKEAQNVIDIQALNPKHKISKTRYPIESAPEIITASPNNWKKVKVASDKEKMDFMRSGSSPQVKETFVNEKMDINWVKIGIVTTCAIVILGIGTLLYIYIPKAVQSFMNSDEKTETKLEWLLTRLNEKIKTDSSIEGILKDYDGTFYPTTAPTQQETSQNISQDQSLTPTPPVATPTGETTDNDKIILAADSIAQAELLGQTNPRQVMVLITTATEALQGINESATAPGLKVNVGEILAKASLLVKNVVNAACYPYYRDAKVKVEQKAYQEAIVLFQKAYDINPDYLDGGNAYNLGKAYSLAGQTANANKYFQYVVDNFPGTETAGWASSRIDLTGAIKE